MRGWAIATARAARGLVDLPDGRSSATLASAGLLFLVVGSQYVIKPVRNAVFVQRVGADSLPYVYIGTAVVIGLLMSAYSRHVAAKLSLRLVIPATYGFFAANLLLFSWLLRHDSLATSVAFYIWTRLYPVLTVSQFWLMMNAVFEPRAARRVFGIIGAGGILGGIAGASLAGLAAEQVGTANLLVLSAIAISVAAGLAFYIHPEATPSASPPTLHVGPAEATAPASRLVWQSPHLRTLAAMLTLGVIASTVVDWQLNKAVELFVVGEDARTAFYGRLFAWVNVASLLVQLLLSRYVIARFGIGVALLLLPLGLLGGSLAILLYPSLWTAAAADGTDGTLRYSLDQSIRELLFLPVPTAIKARAKPFIDVTAQRIGTGIAGVLILLATSIGDISFHYLSFLSMGVIAAWIGLVPSVRRAYVESIKRLIRVRDVDVDAVVVQSLDAEHRRQLTAALEGTDPHEILYALELLELGGEAGAPRNQLARLLRHSSRDVRERTASALVKHGDEVLLAAIQPLLEDKDVEARAEAVRLVCSHCLVGELQSFQMLLSDGRARVRAGAIASGLHSHDLRLSTLAEAELQRLAMEAGAGRAEYRREAALLTAILPPSDSTRRVILQLLDDPDEQVRKAAVIAAGHGRHREVVPGVIRALQSPRTRHEARNALRALGDRIVGTVADHLNDRAETQVVRAQLPRVLAELASPAAVGHLLEALDEPDAEVRYHVLKALNRVRRDHPDLTLDSAAIEKGTLLERDHILSLRILKASSRERGAPGSALLDRVIDERIDDAVERLTRCLGLMYPLDAMFNAYRALASSETERLTQGLELLDAVLGPAHRRLVVPLLEHRESTTSEPAPSVREVAFVDPWLSACLSFVEMGRPSDGDSGEPTDRGVMMTIVERAEFLGRVAMFATVRTEYLARIAAVANEQSLEDGDELFTQGSAPRAIYFVVEGEIAATRDGRHAWVVHPGEAISVLPVLDHQPTLVSATASGPTRLLFVEDEVFNDLMLDNPTLLLGLVRFLSGEVRRLLAEKPEPAAQPF